MSKWIQKAVKKKGSLSRQLRIPVKRNIPVTLLRRVVRAKPGQVIRNPTSVGARRVRVTRLMERRAILALNLKKLKRR